MTFIPSLKAPTTSLLNKGPARMPKAHAPAPPLAGLATLADGIALADARLRIIRALRQIGGRPHEPAPPLSPPSALAGHISSAGLSPIADQALAEAHGADPNDGRAEPTLSLAQLTLLRRLASARYGAYHTAGGGYSIGGGGGPDIARDDMRHLVGLGLAWTDETGGSHGSTKISARGRDHLRDLHAGVIS